MRFLCLHGMGTNSHVFETQLCIEAFYPASDQYFAYYHAHPQSITEALSQLHRYLEEEGPFDGAIGFSQGACLIATYLIHQTQQAPSQPLPVRCAIFFSAARPFHVPSLQAGEIHWLDEPGLPPVTPLALPTAHLWGTGDAEYGDQSQQFCGMCEEGLREVHLHALGHEIPGPRAKEEVQGCVRAINRTIERAGIDR
ncbi:DUF341 domain protein [Aspergillus saccharolyticus JOP 1030-1]|uniref:DUF341 domain protein n=1 Tax=Aspergillus saccharolyticus JOP 1030-1 TaxID=1450539 RepID=A0A318Z9L7_9EURO|nr:DUF341 domain protein [Aspergillus saccharolyticus JOP 1030-1]PYH44101.1 DUF341 domain protein [Aspergillus saccharolyticus JOP 1030-1]